MLFLGANDQITLQNSYIRNTSGRSPKVGTTGKITMHAVNNYWQNTGGHAFEVKEGGSVLMEGNVFENVTTPITAATASDGGVVFNVPTASSANTCTAYLGRACQANSLSGSGTFPSYTNAGALTPFNMSRMVHLLLRYGADPHSMVCVTDHMAEIGTEDPPESCNRIALVRLLGLIVPAEHLTQLQNLRTLCSDETIMYTLRRNQQKRAVRSLLTSEGNLAAASPPFSLNGWVSRRRTEDDRFDFLDSLTGLRHSSHAVCSQCSKRFDIALAIWCIDCQGLSYLCINCSWTSASEVPILEEPCKGFCVTSKKDHTSITVLWKKALSVPTDPADNDRVDLLGSRHSTDQAIDVIKEWYAKDPIKPDLSFEEVISGIASIPSPQDPHQSLPEEPGDDSGHTSSNGKREWPSP